MANHSANILAFNARQSDVNDAENARLQEALRDAQWEIADLKRTIAEMQEQRRIETEKRDRFVALAESKLAEKERCVLTSIPNRDAFNYEATYRQRRANKGMDNLFFIMIDLTKFKNINDTYGHKGGDTVLQQVAVGLKRAVRKEDMVIHFSGDEFGVLISGDKAGAEEVFRKIEEMFQKIIIPIGDHNVRVQGNMGMAEYIPGEALQTLVSRADHKMYETKQAKGIESRNKPGTLTIS